MEGDVREGGDALVKLPLAPSSVEGPSGASSPIVSPSLQPTVGPSVSSGTLPADPLSSSSAPAGLSSSPMGPPPNRVLKGLPKAVGWQQYWDRREEVELEGRWV